MTDLKLFVDANNDVTDKVIICQSNADKIGVKNGDTVEVINTDNNLKKVARVEISDNMLDFAGQIAKNILDDLQFSGVELTIRKASTAATLAPTVRIPKVPLTQPTPVPQEPSSLSPLPSPPPAGQPSQPISPPQPTTQPISTPPPQPIPQPITIPEPVPQPTPTPHLTPPPLTTPAPQPNLSPLPSPPPIEVPSSPTTQPITQPSAPVDPYQNRIEVTLLREQKRGIIIKPMLDNSIEGGRVQISEGVLQQLGLGQGMLIGWEDPLTRAMGSARIDATNISPNEIKMSFDTYEDTNIKSEQIVIYSTEPPIEMATELMLEVESQPNLMGYALVSPRTQYALSIKQDDIIAFEDELTGAMGASKVEVMEETPDNVIIIDSEVLEASGIGSFEVKISKNQRSKVFHLESHRYPEKICGRSLVPEEKM
jgi:hypothetical protein